MTDAHFDGLHAMNSDPAVMRYITGKPNTPEDTWAMIERVKTAWETFGYSWWTLFEIETGEIVGAGCIQHLGRDPENPHEIGWRLRQDQWGKGFASEAAHRMASFAFDELEAPLLCAVCQPSNLASSHVMKKLGMAYQGEEEWYGMTTSVYEIARAEWLRLNAPQAHHKRYGQ
jgi:RimJ/RimL family protein N-acetyltransferase